MFLKRTSLKNHFLPILTHDKNFKSLSETTLYLLDDLRWNKVTLGGC